MEDIGCLIILILMFITGVIAGVRAVSDMVTELENECIVYENNVYCKEVAD